MAVVRDCCNSLVPLEELLLCKLKVGLQYDVMELIKHSNAENKVRKRED